MNPLGGGSCVGRNPIGKVSHRLMYEDVAEAIRDFIRQRQLWGKRLFPERELARQLGVSRRTVRRGVDVLERRGLVCRQQGRGTLVLQEPSAQRLSAFRRVMVGARYDDPYGRLGSATAGVTEVAADRGWQLSFGDLSRPAGRARFLDELKRGGIDATVLISVAETALVEHVLTIWRGPLVAVDHHFPGLPIASVMDDSEGGARAAVEHLLSMGHRRIAYVEIGRRELNPWRYEGYAGALRKAGINLDRGLVRPARFSVEGGRCAAEELLALDDPPTGIVAFDETRALGVWRAAEERGFEVGRDLALVSFRGASSDAGAVEGLSTVQHDVQELGRLAAEKLEELGNEDTQQNVLVKVPVRLTIRESSRDCRGPAWQEESSFEA